MATVTGVGSWRVAARFAFDSNSLSAGGGCKAGLLPASLPLYVPLIVLQELLFQQSSPDSEPRARRALRAMRAQPVLALGPGFADGVRPCFGERPRQWPKEQVAWREALDLAAGGAAWPAERRIWNDLFTEGETAVSARQFALMKAKKGEFVASYMEIGSLLAPDRKEEWRRMSEGLTRPQARVVREVWDERSVRLARMMMLTEIAAVGAALAGVGDADETFQEMTASDDPDSGRLRVDLFNRLILAYRGGLEFVLDVSAVNQWGHLKGAS